MISITGTLASSIGRFNPFRYRGYYMDTETGYYYLNTRYYDPVVGRFLNADGYVNANGGFTGYNMFAYCNNNPIMYSDPNGMCATCTMAGLESCGNESTQIPRNNNSYSSYEDKPEYVVVEKTTNQVIAHASDYGIKEEIDYALYDNQRNPGPFTKDNSQVTAIAMEAEFSWDVFHVETRADIWVIEGKNTYNHGGFGIKVGEVSADAWFGLKHNGALGFGLGAGFVGIKLGGNAKIGPVKISGSFDLATAEVKLGLSTKGFNISLGAILGFSLSVDW